MKPEYHYPYHINIFYNAEDGDYIADVPDFKYISAFGDTPEEALREVLVARICPSPNLAIDLPFILDAGNN